MSDVADRDKNGTPLALDIASLATDEIGFFMLLLFSAGWIACAVLVAAGTVLFYPLAWLFGFKPRRWWAKADDFHWSHFLRNTAIALFLWALAASCVIVVFTKYS